MNNDLISREALKKELYNFLSENSTTCDWDDIFDVIDNAPTVPLPDFKAGYKQAIIDGKANYSRQQGKWVNHRNDYGHNIADCSVCGHAMQWHDEDEDGVPRFCWFCGAKIDSVED